MNNQHGKVFTVLLVIVIVLLTSLTAVSFFFFQKEIERRKIAELTLDRSKENEGRLDEELKEAKKQVFLLQEKNREADERINSLMDDVELEEGLREELKTEISSLKSQIEKETKAKEQLREELTKTLTSAEQKIKDLEGQLKKEMSLKEKFAQDKVRLQEGMRSGSMWDQEEDPASLTDNSVEAELTDNRNVEVEARVASGQNQEEPVVKKNDFSGQQREGRILTIDNDADFVIVNLGEKDGIEAGMIMSVYRGKQFLGDVKVTRVQPEMAAADLIPPFSSHVVRKNDQVIIK